MSHFKSELQATPTFHVSGLSYTGLHYALKNKHFKVWKTWPMKLMSDFSLISTNTWPGNKTGSNLLLPKCSHITVHYSDHVYYRWLRSTYRPTIDRYISWLSDSRPMHHPICTHLSVDCRLIYWPMYRPICRPRPPIVHMISLFFCL